MTDITIKNSDLTSDGRLKKQYPDIDGLFSCSTDMTSLIGSPINIGDSFFGNDTKIASLIGSPVKVGGNFYCSETNITSLIGAPMIVGSIFLCSNTPITSLQGIGKEYLKEIGDTLFLNGCLKLKSQLLGIILIKKLKEIGFNSNLEVQDIFNKHLKGDRDLLDCKEELMNAGYKEYARL